MKLPDNIETHCPRCGNEWNALWAEFCAPCRFTYHPRGGGVFTCEWSNSLGVVAWMSDGPEFESGFRSFVRFTSNNISVDNFDLAPDTPFTIPLEQLKANVDTLTFYS